jgi:outer membrane protein assembly factor BamB
VLLTASSVFSFTAGGAIFSSAAVSSGMVFFGSADGNLYALG